MDEKDLKSAFPTNSKTSKAIQQENIELPTKEKKLEKVVTGKVKRQKQGLVKKFVSIFLEDDSKSVGEYIVYDILIPAAKAMICDIFGWGGFIEMLLYGDKSRGRAARRSSNTGEYISYRAFYKGADRNSPSNYREISRASRLRHNFDEIILETRGEGEEVLAHLNDLIVDYGQATVSDLYELVDIESSFTDEKYGWTDLRGAGVTRVRGGYLLDLPKPKLLD